MTATASTYRLMNAVRSHVPGALDEQIRAIMFDVMDEFFQFTNVWQQDIPIDIVVNERHYDIAPIGNADIIRLLGVWVADDTSSTDPNHNLWKRCIPATMEVPGEVVLRNPVTSLPTTPYIFHVIVSLKCKDPVTKDGYPIIPQWILDKYRRDFFDGIVGNLMDQPAKPYSNQTLAVYHLRRWRNAMTGARIEVNRRNTYGAQAWVFPQSFRTIPRHAGGGWFGNWPV